MAWKPGRAWSGSVRGGKPELPSRRQSWPLPGGPTAASVVALTESDTPGHFAIIDIDASPGDVQMLNPDLGPIPIANQPIRGLSFVEDQGFLTSLASARSDIWLLEGFRPLELGGPHWGIIAAETPQNPQICRGGIRR